jgi:hypothetical protein
MGLPNEKASAQQRKVRVKRWHTEWEKIFVSYSSDKGLISILYKELQKLSTKRTNIQLIHEQMN